MIRFDSPAFFAEHSSGGQALACSSCSAAHRTGNGYGELSTAGQMVGIGTKRLSLYICTGFQAVFNSYLVLPYLFLFFHGNTLRLRSAKETTNGANDDRMAA
jgi:hypothetical protein